MGDGLLKYAVEHLRESCPAAGYVVISDSTVGALYATELTAAIAESTPCHLLTFPSGESNKTRETWRSLTDRMLALGTGRDCAIVAVGGGVVGDLAGFVAATYLRGVPYVQIPTSLLAMIDSSIGGKTGVDTPAGKNLVGAFHQPRLVIADVGTLTTLLPNQLAAGVAEAIKHGAIADAAYLETIASGHSQIVARDPATMIALVRRSVQIKAAVVQEDEREHGRRAMLNFGHTVGHAVEATTGFELLHGEAVAVGMATEAALGAHLGITEEDASTSLRSALERFELPTSLPAQCAADAMLDAMRRDKKARAGEIHFTLLRRVGEIAKTDDGHWTHPVPGATIRAALNQSF